MKRWWTERRYRSLFREWHKTRQVALRIQDDIKADRICRQCGRLDLAPYLLWEATLAEKLAEIDNGFRCYPLQTAPD